MPLLSLSAETLVFSGSLLGLLSGALTLSLAGGAGPVRRAVLAWSIGIACFGFTLLSHYLLKWAPSYVPLVFGNAAVMAFGLLAVLAYAHLFSLRYSPKIVGLLYAAQLLVIVAFQALGTPRETATLTLSSIFAVELLWAAVLILRHGKDTFRPILWVAAGTMLGFSCLSTARIVMTLRGESPAIALSAQSNVQVATLLATSVAIIASTIAFVLMVRDRQQREALESARRDALTGVLTRRALFEELEALGRQQGRDFALMMVDIDHFKEINDRHGHLGGDAVLTQMGEMLLRITRSTDVAGRYGGEEFCVLLRDCNERDASSFASRLVRTVAGMPVQVPDGSDVKFTISVGYAGGKILEDTISTAVRSSTVREVLARADSALYEAKRSGRNRALGAREDTLFAASSIPTLSRDVVSV